MVGEILLGEIFPGGGGISKFVTGEGGLPPIPSAGKTLTNVIKSIKMTSNLKQRTYADNTGRQTKDYITNGRQKMKTCIE